MQKWGLCYCVASKLCRFCTRLSGRIESLTTRDLSICYRLAIFICGVISFQSFPDDIVNCSTYGYKARPKLWDSLFEVHQPLKRAEEANI